MGAHNGQAEWVNGGQQQQQQQALFGIDLPMLPGSGSQPVSSDQHQSGQHQLAGLRQGPALGQDQGPLPARGQGTGSGVGEVRGSGMSDDDETLIRAAGLEAHAEEELRGLSRLEEDALEAKVAGPIGQLSPFAFFLVAFPSLPFPSPS